MNAEPDVPAGLTPHEVALQLRTWIVNANGYSRNRKHRFSSLSSATKIASLALSGAATIILGLQHLSFWAGLGFSLVALITVVNAVEPFFNWRSRWCSRKKHSMASIGCRKTLSTSSRHARPRT